jgi:hypothetical protein
MNTKIIARHMIELHGLIIRKHDVRVTLSINKNTRDLSENDRDKLTTNVWRQVTILVNDL